MKRVLIIGNCGSGRTTFARTLAERLGVNSNTKHGGTNAPIIEYRIYL